MSPASPTIPTPTLSFEPRPGRVSRKWRIAGGMGTQAFAIGLVAATTSFWWWAGAAVRLGRMQSARAMAAVTVGFGVVMATVHSGEGFTGTRFTLFDGHTGLPNDLAKNLFGGSVALGLMALRVCVGSAFA